MPANGLLLHQQLTAKHYGLVLGQQCVMPGKQVKIDLLYIPVETHPMNNYEYRSTAYDYQQILCDLIGRGRIVKVGDDITQEFSPWLASFKNPRERLIDPPGRNLNFAYCVAEAMDILMDDNPGTALWYNSNLKNWLNKDGIFPGHYGERIDALSEKAETIVSKQQPSQLYRCIQELRERPTSRRATITIHNPLLEDYSSKDVACTMDLQFLLRSGRLQCLAHMRSNDALWGFCYDTWLFQFLQESMAAILGTGLGSYYHIVGSFHFYDQRHKQVKKIATSEEKYNLRKPLLMRMKISWFEWKDNVTALHAACKYAPQVAADELGEFSDAMLQALKNDQHFTGLGIAVISEVARKKKNLDLVENLLKKLPCSGSDIEQWIKRRCKLD